MYAVIVTGGKQYKVREGDVLRVERLDASLGDTVEFEKVLMVTDGDAVKVGKPYVDGGKVSATINDHGLAKKIKVVKFKRRKNYLRNKGHRQDYTEVTITEIAST